MDFKRIISGITAFASAFAIMCQPLSGGRVRLTEEIRVSAEGYTDKAAAVQMSVGAVSFTNSSSKFKAVSVPENGGVYYFNNNAVLFYDVVNNSVTTLASFDKVVDVFADSSRIYVLRYTYASSVYTYYLDVYNVCTETLEKTVNLTDILGYNGFNTIQAIGVDGNGRYYIVSYDSSKSEKPYTIHLLSQDMTELSSVDIADKVYRFNGFDETNGNFYYEGYTNWVYWGYDHDVDALKCGNVTDNTISVADKYLYLLYQLGFTPHYDSAAMLNENYLALTSTLNGRVLIINSNEFSLSDESLSPIANISRKGYENSYYESVGTRTVYNPQNDSFVMYANNNTIVEFDSDINEISSYETQYPVFSLLNYGDKILAVERDTDENYYVEIINWTMPSEVTLSQTSAELKTGESISLSAFTDSAIDYGFTWSSDNNSVASVDSDGIVYANKPGTAVITATVNNGISASCTVTVSAKESSPSSDTQVPTSGTTSNNISDNNYSTWSSVINSNLCQNTDGTLTRVESTGSGVIVETYSSDGKTLISSKTIQNELSLFGGFFCGADNNYLVFGQQNSDESDEAEVVRVVKYTKSWSRVSDCRIYGANTYIPFDAGSLRMTELDGKLYVYTCHEMYADDDGVHHQANMLFTIDESTMETVDSMYEVSNLNSGYVSHSFNQFIKTDGTYIYRVDHSESNNFIMSGSYLSVNGITLTRYHKDSTSDNVRVTVPLKFDIRNGNYTGASIGGFELSGRNCLIAYNKDISSSCKNRNVYVSINDKALNTLGNVALTSYTASDNISCRTPQLVKINNNLFLVMWEEYNSTSGKVTAKVTTIDSNGNTVFEATDSFIRLSDCQPVLCNDGCVKWYVTNGGAPTIYSVDPYDLMSVHSHTYSGKITKSATCTTAGIRTYTCASCGDSYTETISATGHTSVTDKAVSATCTTAGKTAGSHCSVCGAVIKAQQTVPATGHKYDSGKVTKSSTCTATGTKTYTCTACGATKTETISATGHKYSTDWTTDKKATCTEAGSKSHHCTICDAKTDVTAVPATGHKYDSGKVTKASTCTATGTKTYTCTACGATKTETISATGHKYSTDWTTDKKATCTEAGSKSHHCTVCDAKTDVTAVPATGHSYKDTVVAPTYAEQGYTLHKCTVCGHSYKDSYTPKKTVAEVVPTNFTCTSGTVSINWNKVEDASGYRIYRYNSTTKKWSSAVTVSGGNTLTYRQTGLKTGTTYKYKVKAYVKSNGTTYWGEASPTITTTTKPAKVVMKSAYTATTKAIRINWTAVTGATGYRVYRYNPSTKKWDTLATIKDGSANTYKDIKSLKSKTSYMYKVKAYRTVGGVNYWGEASTAKTCKTK